MAAILVARQVDTNNGDEVFFDDGERSFWWTQTGQIVKWSIFFGLFFLFILYMAVGYWHAKRRIRKGLAPLGYHRWLLNRQQRAEYDPAYRNPSAFYNPYPRQQAAYGMHSMPPPMYDPNKQMPPTYSPPAGATKVDPSQWRSEPTRRPAEISQGEAAPEYEAPPGPPPAALRPDNTGTSNNPYRV